MKFKNKSLFFIILISFSNISFNREIITNDSGLDPDGFGSQFQFIIACVIYAELNNKKFVYTPFKKIDHNYNNDPDFFKKKEWLINFIDNFELDEKNVAAKHDFYKEYFDDHITECANSASLNNIRKLFRANKNIKNYFNNDNFNIAIHIRRPNPHDIRINGTNIPNEFYLNIINKLRKNYSLKKPLFHIFSQGKKENFEIFKGNDIFFHLDESIEDTFCSMTFADVLIAAPSSFSYTAGIISENIVYCAPFWHKPLPHWISTDILLGTAEKLKYNLVEGLPDIYITSFTEKIGQTWKNGIVYDKALIQKFYNLLKASYDDSFVMLDLGAQTGSFSLLAKYFPNSKWYAFEPIPEAAAILRENLNINEIKNVDVQEFAASNFSGISTIRLPTIEHWGLSTLGQKPHFSITMERKIECIELDNFVINENIKKVNFMKLDTEGFEFYILNGAKKMISRDKPIILMEYNEANMKQCNVKKDDIHNLLTDLGYSWKVISNNDILCIPI